MNESLQTVYGGSSIISAEQRNRVLRNTYWLLALSLVPTVLGAWIGVSTGIFARMGMGLSLLVFLGGAFGFIFAIHKTKDSAAGVGVLLGFTFFMGLMLSQLLGAVLGTYKNGASLIITAFGGTAGVFFAVASLSTIIKRDLSSMGKFLTVGIVALIVVSLLNMLFLHSSALMLTMSVAAVALFAAYLLYDIKQVIDGGETNYITATLQIYLDLINIFQNLLVLLGALSGERE
jgi:modulator of FtsH protease